MTSFSLPLRRAGAVLIAVASAALTLACGGSDAQGTAEATPLPLSAREFNGEAAMGYVRAQMAFGPRVPGTAAHRNTADWLVAELRKRADSVEVQSWTHTAADGKRLPMRNIIARFNPTATRRVLYLAHWDSRPIAEKSIGAEAQTQPTPGANDGASGVAILLGVADALKAKPASVGVDLLFVDGEDWGDFDTDTDVLIGSRYFVANKPSWFAPEFGVLFDMVGQPDARFLYETYSMRAAPDVIQRVWTTAQRLGYAESFPTREYQPITDDHLPFIQAGYKVIDIIDLNYAYHHTTDDTEDKVSAATLQVVGDVAVAVLRGL